MSVRDRWAVVRNDSTIPGGLRIVGMPTHDEDQARRLAASYMTPHEVVRLDEVYRRRTAALNQNEASDG